MRRTVAITFMALLMASWLTACGDDPDRAHPGELFSHDGNISPGTQTLVSLPVGTISVRASRLLADLYAVWGATDTPPTAPDGGGFVGLELTLDNDDSILQLSRPPGDARAATVTLVADRARYRLESPYDVIAARGAGASHDPASTRSDSAGPIYVAIAAGTKMLSLEMEYDGAVQSVDLLSGELTTGAAEGMYEASADHAPLPQDSCGTIEPTGPVPRAEFDDLTCTIPEAALVPYTADLGWAPPGRRWAIVSTRTQLAGPLGWSTSNGERLTNYRTTTFTSDVRLNGRVADAVAAMEPEVAPLSDTARDQRRTYTWQTGARDPTLLTVRAAFVGSEPAYSDRGAPNDTRIAFEKTVTLRF